MLIAAAESTSLTNAIATMAGVSLIFAVAGVVTIVVANRAADGRLGINGWAGIRTRATRASPEAWLAAHQASHGLMRVAGTVGVVSAVAVFIIGTSVATSRDPDTGLTAWGISLTVASLLLVAVVVAASLKGQAAAKATQASD